MAAYVIADILVKDAAAYEGYKKGVGATVEKYGGRFLVRGGEVKSLEGGWQPPRMIVLEFPDMAALEAWYASPEYKPLLDMRLGAATGGLIAVQGT